MGQIACTSCGARILWATTTTGAKMPLDEEQLKPESHGGLYATIDLRGAFVLVKRVDGQAPLAVSAAKLAELVERLSLGGLGVALYRSHFSSCPEASKHRKTKAA